MITDHEQVTVTNPQGYEIEVDAGIYPLLKTLWDREVFTQWSCQGYRPHRRRAKLEDRAYVLGFQSLAFDEVVQALKAQHEGFSKAFTYDWPEDDLQASPRALRRNRYSIEGDPGWDGGLPRTCLRFPAADLNMIASILRK